MPCFYNEGRWRKAKEAFWGKIATNNYLRVMMIILKLNLRNDSLKRSAVWDVEIKDWMKSFCSFNLCVWACVCASVFFLCVGLHMVTHLMDWPVCVHNATTMCPHLLMLIMSLLVSSLILCNFYPHFVFVRMQMSPIKFLL